ncbi:hypothetical protein [Aquimarina mytili]|uniref:Uncharacterized protein n=1 Tax=Aquimarina mytili TaxID=874423 RepID=A0A937A0A1_9FLAO|nr:hypothetical protein [Aquimarina mytili]MBL0685238.1 hypothetical protein [Aquimarina mytili]
MKNMFLKTACFILILSTLNCTSAQKAGATDTSETKTDAQNIPAKEMIEKGFSKGTLTASKSEGCPFILNVEAYKDNLDPINLNDFFNPDEVPDQVWVKYANLRMPSRCNDARPVSLLEIRTRKE